MGITFTFYIKQNYIPVNIGVLSFNIFTIRQVMFVSREKSFYAKSASI